ncbi:MULTISPECIES: adenylyl-sulfate kinase [unclassified Rhodococcus (in: high G+C Gram-positive bacteria)]|uniref:adenylyl-sulfate kinase n=1 Tax=unclassified Rhodococcus (in: high G+C Gram-positive bacteria) TaxID=192944 RepID=UPI001639E28C|nr:MULTISPECIES: adenylyl-sulfate kinase [unclassified Rhodococcus (in: high G+C Gram-positive bacteria)]MBC2638715.1 adenylyl-sulfate kinase [Rhodococcus sp. 3A]MBC2896544.1 adenylyl-sulfate kinase [Rhodococcus sp. 4CII]
MTTIGRPRQLLRLATAGSVDDGKSTLIGRLLHDTGSLPTDHLEAVTDADGEADLAALSDGLRAEREQGITIDVAYRFFSTPTRSFVLADTPGHERYTRNMFTGASNTHVAVLLVDARAGVLRQTRRHARIADLLGVPHLVAVVNKIDLVDFDETRFKEVEAELGLLAQRLGGRDLTVIPVSATRGDNVVARSDSTPWYDGPTILEYLEGVELAAPSAVASELRLPIQWVARPTDHQRRRYTGRLSAGTLSVGDEVLVLPAGSRSAVTALDTLDPNRAVAVAPLSVSFELADDLDVARGDLVVSAAADATAPVAAREIDATVCWLSETPLRAGDRVALKHTSRMVRATVQALHTRLDPETLEEHDSPGELALNDIGRITLRTSTVVLADPYATNRDAGAFILIDEQSNDTVGAGTVSDTREVVPGAQTRNDIKWHPSSLDRERRWTATGQRGATIWLTGLPASGKSTVAVALERTLVDAGRAAYLLDGDNVRHGISDDLGFTPGDRAENIRRVGHLTRLFADAGVVAIASMVSPLRSDRAIARALNEAADLPFLEIHVSTPVEECERRDPKGLYARARAGELRGLTGIDAPYEAPENPDLAFDTTGADLDDLVARVLAELARHEARR